MKTVKQVLSVVGYVGTLIGMYYVGEAVGAYYWNRVIVKAFDVEKI